MMAIIKSPLDCASVVRLGKVCVVVAVIALTADRCPSCRSMWCARSGYSIEPHGQKRLHYYCARCDRFWETDR